MEVCRVVRCEEDLLTMVDVANVEENELDDDIEDEVCEFEEADIELPLVIPEDVLIRPFTSVVEEVAKRVKVKELIIVVELAVTGTGSTTTPEELAEFEDDKPAVVLDTDVAADVAAGTAVLVTDINSVEVFASRLARDNMIEMNRSQGSVEFEEEEELPLPDPTKTDVVLFLPYVKVFGGRVTEEPRRVDSIAEELSKVGKVDELTELGKRLEVYNDEVVNPELLVGLIPVCDIEFTSEVVTGDDGKVVTEEVAIDAVVEETISSDASDEDAVPPCRGESSLDRTWYV